MRPFASALLMFLAMGFPACALAWGDEGHEVVALIAMHYLEPTVRDKVAQMLALDASGLVTDTGMAQEATWADRYRDSDRQTTATRYRHTRAWHYVDLELAQPDLDSACHGHPALKPGVAASEGPAEDCIVDKIEQFRRELRNPATLPEERRIALQFLLHLVGDVHQPLHAADDRDHGGNSLHVRSAGGYRGSLHGFWDNVAVERLGHRSEDVADRLIATMPAALEPPQTAGSAAAWALESYDCAVFHVYGRLPRTQPFDGSRGVLLDDAYEAEAARTAALQLQRAGVRLAALLDEAMR